MDAINAIYQRALDTAYTENNRLRLENAVLKRQVASLRQMIPLLKTRLEAFLIWFQGTVDGIH